VAVTRRRLESVGTYDFFERYNLCPWLVLSIIGSDPAETARMYFEDHAVGYARPVTAKRMIHFLFGKQDKGLLEDTLLLMCGWMAGTGTLLRIGKLRELPE
jgi:hypothetical protein